jgi:hypothetical protein
MTSKSLRRQASRSGSLRRLVAAHGRDSREHSTAAASLGNDHRLVRTLDLLAVLRRQLLLSCLAVAFGALAIAGDVSWAPAVIVAAAFVTLVLVLATIALRSLKRTLALELIIDGRGSLPLRALERERQRLSSPQTQTRLARALERVVRTAAAWPRIQRTARPVFDVRIVRAATPLLLAVTELLRSQPAEPCAVARIEHLLTVGGSPLYGQELDDLLRELELIRRELERDQE